MSSKLKLKPDATFKCSVAIPVAGGEAEAVEIEFRARTRTELEEFVKAMPEYGSDTDLIMDCAVGWNIAAEFSRENVAVLLDNYPGSGVCIVNSYLKEYDKARLGN